ncbi:SGNH/GDSL hydrolase family protein [Neotamlana laminarinivorans]|uniref:G-D-S-L family lipolytic protein n=1 Tax=Neotamlana laminarinivorans TaxID=2883124 RepID=A0A9X1I0M0_9FLAO|nr:G-D-S-L family lipolytic protein [Tamlana laminarinivorans]MCB4798002.1 G-D-S-L family lipolytic protein [Tamlana laminarinivorans]
MKNTTYTKYTWLFVLLIGFVSCNEPEDVLADFNIDTTTEESSETLVTGTADFSTYVAIGNSLTAGFTDNALFIASQENSIPNILSQKFQLLGSGTFTQPLMNDNYGGLILGGNVVYDPTTGEQLFAPRLVTTGGAPLALTDVIGNVTPTTDFLLNNPTGPFNNMGVPGAKSYHIIAPGYGNIANFPTAANPYYIRMTGSTPDASILELSLAQNPTFFTLWAGNNDVLGYATSGGDSSDPITDETTFNYAVSTIVNALTASGAKGVMANIPYVTDIPHFTTVPYNALDPTDEDTGADLVAQIPTLNTVYGALNQIFSVLDPSRIITFSESEANGVVVHDETLTDLSTQITASLSSSDSFSLFVQSLGLSEAYVPLVATLMGNYYGQARQATENDLLVLSSSSIIGEVNTTSYATLLSYNLSPELAAQFSVEGITLPLEDKWVLLPSEQEEIKTATDIFNTTLKNAADNAGLAFVDANALLSELATTGLASDNFILTSSLVTGGAFSLDGVHLTARGYAHLANEFMKAIDTTYGSNFEASGNLVDIGNYPTNYSPLLQ